MPVGQFMAYANSFAPWAKFIAPLAAHKHQFNAWLNSYILICRTDKNELFRKRNMN